MRMRRASWVEVFGEGEPGRKVSGLRQVRRWAPLILGPDGTQPRFEQGLVLRRSVHSEAVAAWVARRHIPCQRLDALASSLDAVPCDGRLLALNRNLVKDGDERLDTSVHTMEPGGA
eukprot:scaffold7841_cov128-Isochrysis_galbana.AAC.15